MISENSEITFIDLFAGCGGLSEGFYKQGFKALAHVEIDHYACRTLKSRMIHYNYQDADEAVLEMDITSTNIIEKIESVVKNSKIDLIIGGPPCQSFSSLGRARDEHGMKFDPRNYLFESYVRILHNFNPKFFVFENVTGILTAKLNGRRHIETVLEGLGVNYKVMNVPKNMVLNAANYGVPQIRKRVIIIGIRKDIGISPEEIYDNILKTNYDPEMPEKQRQNLEKFVTVKEAIEDLPKLKPGEGKEYINFTSPCNNTYIAKLRSPKDKILRNHVARTHNKTDIERYSEMAKNHWTFKELLENRHDLHHPKQRVFNNSYAVQWWDQPSKTIIAHLYKDGNQFIHPDHTQGRTITVREAARLMSFPDDFVFEGSRTEQFKQVGNAVPPLFAEAIAKCIKDKLYMLEKVEK